MQNKLDDLVINQNKTLTEIESCLNEFIKIQEKINKTDKNTECNNKNEKIYCLNFNGMDTKKEYHLPLIYQNKNFNSQFKKNVIDTLIEDFGDVKLLICKTDIVEFINDHCGTIFDFSRKTKNEISEIEISPENPQNVKIQGKILKIPYIEYFDENIVREIVLYINYGLINFNYIFHTFEEKEYQEKKGGLGDYFFLAFIFGVEDLQKKIIELVLDEIQKKKQKKEIKYPLIFSFSSLAMLKCLLALYFTINKAAELSDLEKQFFAYMLIQNPDKLGEIQSDKILSENTKEIFITVQEIISNFQNNELTLNSIKLEMSVRKNLISQNINECLEKDEEFDFSKELNEIEKFYHKKIEQLINQNKKLEQQMDEQEKKLNESLQKEKSLQLQINDYQNKTLDFFYKHTQEQPQVICELIKQAGKQNEYLELLNPQQKNGQQTNNNGQFQEQIQNSNHQNGSRINYNGNQLEESKSNYQQQNQNGGYNDQNKQNMIQNNNNYYNNNYDNQQIMYNKFETQKQTEPKNLLKKPLQHFEIKCKKNNFQKCICQNCHSELCSTCYIIKYKKSNETQQKSGQAQTCQNCKKFYGDHLSNLVLQATYEQ